MSEVVGFLHACAEINPLRPYIQGVQERGEVMYKTRRECVAACKKHHDLMEENNKEVDALLGGYPSLVSSCTHRCRNENLRCGTIKLIGSNGDEAQWWVMPCWTDRKKQGLSGAGANFAYPTPEDAERECCGSRKCRYQDSDGFCHPLPCRVESMADIARSEGGEA